MSTILLTKDADLRETVMEEIQYDPAVTVHDIVVLAKDGVITLEGIADSYGTRLAAENAAGRMYGVRNVINNIEVNPKLLGQPDDREIEADLRQRLEKDFLVPKGRVSFSVNDGIVTLSGTVNWHAQREAAREEAANTKGVRMVKNLIEIDRSAPSPKNISEEILKALRRSAQVEAKNINVMADGGHVTLSGSVHTFAERREAEDAAWRAKGVWNVTDKITINPF